MDGIIQKLSSAATLVFVIFLGGCAFGTRQATLIYPPAPEEGQLPIARAAAKPNSKNIQIAIVQFNDQRSDKNVVGTVRNTFGMKTADVVAVNSVTEWVSKALATELQNSGYTVRSGAPGDSSATAGAVVSGDILNIFCDMYMTYTGQVSLVARVSRGGKELFSNHYAGEGSAGVAWAATAESFAQSLAIALSSAVKKLVSDLDARLTAQ